MDFEGALAICGYGIFNVCLLLVAVPAVFAGVIEMQSISYVIPMIDCKLDLTVLHRSILKAMPFAGMMISGLVWGYIADTLGRKPVLIMGHFFHFLAVVSSGLAQNFSLLLITKLIGGIAIMGPMTVIMTYVADFHSIIHRDIIIMVLGMFITISKILLPVMAYFLLPSNTPIALGNLRLSSSNIFLLICSIPSLVCGICFLIFPESPRYLLTRGNSDRVLKIFQTIFTMNQRRSSNEYPVTSLKDLESSARKSFFVIQQGTNPLKSLFTSPLLFLSLRIYFLNFFVGVANETITLWLPQLFSALTELEAKSPPYPTMCDIIQFNAVGCCAVSPDCVVLNTTDGYLNMVMVYAVNFLVYLVGAYCIRLCGIKVSLKICFIACFGIGLALYWATNTLILLPLAATYVSYIGVAEILVVSIAVRSYPPTMRSLILVTTMMSARFGTVIGNILLAGLIQLHCILPFIMVSCSMLIALITTCILPNIPIHR